MTDLSTMTDEQISALVKKTAEETAQQVVERTFLTLGIDASNPMEMQADMQHLRAWRNSVATVKRQGLVSAVGIIVIGVLGLIWRATANGTRVP